MSNTWLDQNTLTLHNIHPHVIHVIFQSQTTAVWQLIVMLYFVNLCYAIMENQVMTRLTKSVEAKDTSECSITVFKYDSRNIVNSVYSIRLMFMILLFIELDNQYKSI